MAKCNDDCSGQLAKATNCLNKVFKYEKFKSDQQEKAITNVLRRQNDVFISLPVGHGRALCYELPAVIFSDTQSTLIICALKHRMGIHVKKLREFGIPCEVLDKNMVLNDVFKIMDNLNNGTMIQPCLLYVTLEIVSMDNFKTLFTYLHRNKKLAFVVFDETHLEQHWYNTQYLKVDYYEKMGNLRELFPELSWVVVLGKVRQNAVMSLQESLKLKTDDCQFKMFSAPVFKSNIFYDCMVVDSLEFHHLKEFIDQCLTYLKPTGALPLKNGSGLIYCKNGVQSKEIAVFLRERGISIACLHRDLSYTAIKGLIDDFIRGVYSVLSVTSYTGRTLPGSLNLNFIVHWGLPGSLMSYYVQTSEAGLDGSDAWCRIYETKQALEFYREDRESELLEKADNGNDADSIKLTIYINSRVMKDYIMDIKCRHATISEFYGDAVPKCVDKCDTCVGINNLCAYATLKKQPRNPDKDKKIKMKIKALTKQMMMQNI